MISSEVSLEFEVLDHLILASQVVFYEILHYDSVEGDVPPCQQFLVEQLLAHELHEDVFVFGLYLRQHALVGHLLQV